MNDEQKKAIEIVKEIKNIKFKVTSSFYSSGTVSLNIEEKEAIDTVLNLITKLQKENEEKDKTIEKYIKIYKEYDCYRWVKELEKKDKQIDLMGEVIFQKFKPQLVLEYGIENKEDFIKLFEEQSKEKGEI